MTTSRSFPSGRPRSPRNDDSNMGKPDGGEKKKSFRKSFMSVFSSSNSSNGNAPEPHQAPHEPPPAYTVVDASPTGDSSSIGGRPSSPLNHTNSLRNPYRERQEGAADALPALPRPSREAAKRRSDPYALLSQIDTVFLIDDSGSMAGPRWDEVRTVLYQIAPLCAQHDADGIDIEFLNSFAKFEHVKDPAVVSEIFRTVYPAGLTPTGERISEILYPYLDRYEADKRGTKPINLIVITDGRPTDTVKGQYDVEEVLVYVANRLDMMRAPHWQVGVQFFQVGNDKSARRALEHLDDNLGGAAARRRGLRDIVDTCTFDARDDGASVLTMEAVLKTVLGAVVKKYDSQVLTKRNF